MRWLRHYDQGIPETLAPYPERTLLDYLAEAARRARPARPALLFKGATVTYGELERVERRVRGGLSALGVRRGDRVGPAAAQLPAVPHRRARRLEARRDRRRR